MYKVYYKNFLSSKLWESVPYVVNSDNVGEIDPSEKLMCFFKDDMAKVAVESSADPAAQPDGEASKEKDAGGRVSVCVVCMCVIHVTSI